MIKVKQRASRANRDFYVKDEQKIKFWKKMAQWHPWKKDDYGYYGIKIIEVKER